MQKTNAMRILDKLKTPHECFEYPHGGTALEGTEVARLLGQDPACVFKTLATSGAGGVFIFVIPVNRELDLKKAAAAVGEKSVAMLPVAKLVQTVGYARGACSPIGMKKQFVTRDLQALALNGGASGIMIGGYLTTAGRGTDRDMQMLKDLDRPRSVPNLD